MGREELIEALGHDGTELVAEQFPRAFHMQEFLPIAFKANLFPVYIEFIPSTEYPNGHVVPLTSQVKFFNEQVNKRFGVMECRRIGRNVAHAVYFEKGMIYDPSGNQYTYPAMRSFANLTPIGAYVCP